MPTNVSPEFKKAEAAYRRASEPKERLDLLREMLASLPKHKGTEHLQADIKTRIKEHTEELTGPRKTGARGGPPTTVRPEGAGQIVLLGPPNSGKSALHAALTGSQTSVGEFPFTTQFPQPGMMPVEDVAIQLVDLPAISPAHPLPWTANAVQQADGCLLVVDVGHPGCAAEVADLFELLGSRNVHLVPEWGGATEELDDPFAIVLPTLVVGTKADTLEDPEGEVRVLCELLDFPAELLTVSSETGDGLEELGRWLFDALGVVRVYTKLPGKPPDLDRPYTVRSGDTVEAVARLVHRDMASRLRYARLWSGSDASTRQVGREYVVADGDVVELHL